MNGEGPGRPAFIVSFDCEGNWGMMDHLEEHGRLRAPEHEAAYARILELLDKHRIKATFAFVGAHAMGEEEARAKQALFTEAGQAARSWLEPYFRDMRAGLTEGWFAPEAVAAVRKAGPHELGSHGFCHLPLLEGRLGLEDFDRELSSVRETEAFAGAGDLTLVYPRNQIGFESRLDRHGFVGYRDSLAARKHERSSRLRHFFDEANPFPSAEPHSRGAAAAVRIPAGRMLNWRAGKRAAIPLGWTSRLWRGRFDDAVRAGRVAHLWSHPHNFITGREMYELFDRVLAAAAPRVRSGELWNPTMLEYARTLR